MNLSILLWLLALSAPAPHCFVPSDQTAGWKRVVLPADAPALAAPEGVDQFRSGEQVLLVEQDPRAFMMATKESPGTMTYSFVIPSDARRLEVTFYEDLDGAKVDAVGYEGGTYPLQLLSERQIGRAHV